MAKKKIERLNARDGYSLWSETYDTTPNPVVAMDSRSTLRLLKPCVGEVILDAGCGTGRNLEHLLRAKSNPIGIDFSSGMVRVAHRKYPRVPIAIADLQRPLPFIDASFDAILCALIGEHLDELAKVLNEFLRVLRENGRLVFSVYHPAMSAAGIEANFEHAGVEYRLGAIHYSVEDHVRLFEDAGFEEITAIELWGDEQLVKSEPVAAKYLNSPLLLVLIGKKSDYRSGKARI